MFKNYKAKQGFTGCSNHSMVELRAANSLKSAGSIYTKDYSNKLNFVHDPQTNTAGAILDWHYPLTKQHQSLRPTWTDLKAPRKRLKSLSAVAQSTIELNFSSRPGVNDYSLANLNLCSSRFTSSTRSMYISCKIAGSLPAQLRTASFEKPTFATCINFSL